MVIMFGNRVASLQPNLNLAQYGGKNSSELQIRKLERVQSVGDRKNIQTPLYLFTNTAMPASAEGLIWTVCAFADGTKSVVYLFAIFVHVGFERLSSNAIWVAPPRGIPDLRVGPNSRIRLADSRRSKNIMALRNDIGFIIGRCRERG